MEMIFIHFIIIRFDEICGEAYLFCSVVFIFMVRVGFPFPMTCVDAPIPASGPYL